METALLLTHGCCRGWGAGRGVGFWVPDLTCSAAAVAPTVAAAAAVAAAAVVVRAQIINLTNCPDDWQTKAAATAASTDLHSSLVLAHPSPLSPFKQNFVLPARLLKGRHLNHSVYSGVTDIFLACRQKYATLTQQLTNVGVAQAEVVKSRKS